MTLLGDRMLAAGVVSKADAARIHRQEVIKRERERKIRERRKAREKLQDQVTAEGSRCPPVIEPTKAGQ